MNENTDIKNMEAVIFEIKEALNRPFEYQNISSKLQELLSIIEKSPQETILNHMNDILFISTLVLELNNIINGLMSEIVRYVSSKGFSARA